MASAFPADSVFSFTRISTPPSPDSINFARRTAHRWRYRSWPITSWSAWAVRFIVLTLLGLFFRWRGTLFEKRWLLWIFVVAVVGPYLANEAGWVATEVGRQPFIVYPEHAERMERGADGLVKMQGGLRTIDGISSSRVVGREQVIGSIMMFSVIYALLFAVWVYVLHSKIRHGPEEAAPPPSETSTKALIETVGTPLRELPHRIEAER